ncbi:beta-1,6-N-acetylglucosaminyltransferase [Bradyrhizobium sp. ORS 86]|uniref:beta-1,6-N-acetylglucosaminyltransferase n=1 Tax=Bradyrhizobium sp. ORS 86 TaxID=1685970 RepID=UPI00388E6FBC
MNVAYLILAHRQPEQLARLVCELQSPSTEIFVHIDAHADIAPFQRAVGSRAHFTTKRIPIHWGDYSLIRAALLLMEAGLAAPRRCDYLVLISGTDYPLRSVDEIEEFFRENNGTEFIDSVAMPSEAAAKPLSRLTQYKGRPGPVGWWIGKGRKLLGGLGVVPMARDYKKWFGELAPYAGNQWWALTRDACTYIQKFADEHPKFMKFYENTHVPDEMVFQTILANSPFRSKMRRSITYSDWSGGGANPSEIGERHIAMFRANPCMKIDGIYGSGELLFCRKVTDATVSEELAVMIRQRNARM